jgi:hypothetical protein
MLYNSGQMTVAGVGMTIQSVTGPTVKVVQLADIPFELVDDDLAVMPHLPDTSLLQDKFSPAYIQPVIDGGGDMNNNKTNVAFKRNITATTNAGLEAEITVPRALESDGNRTDYFWVAYVLTAYQSHTNPSMGIGNRADQDPNQEIALRGVTTQLNGKGAIIFFEEERDAGALTTIYESLDVVHEISHEFGLPDRSGSSTDIMSSTFNLNVGFIPGDLDTLRKRVKSPGHM